MREPSDDELDYLLSRGALSGPKKAQILEGVLGSATARPAKARRRWWAWGGGTGLVLAAGAAAVALWPGVHGTPALDFRAKGEPRRGPAIEMSCLGAVVKACPLGSLVAFSIEGATGGGAAAGAFVSAYAVPVSGGERIWYLTNEPVAGRLIPRAARIGDEHRPGLYRVEAVLSRRPLPRAALAEAEMVRTPAEVVARERFDLQVIP